MVGALGLYWLLRRFFRFLLPTPLRILVVHHLPRCVSVGMRSVGLLILHGALDNHPFFLSRAALGCCVLTTAAVHVPCAPPPPPSENPTSPCTPIPPKPFPILDKDTITAVRRRHHANHLHPCVQLLQVQALFITKISVGPNALSTSPETTSHISAVALCSKTFRWLHSYIPFKRKISACQLSNGNGFRASFQAHIFSRKTRRAGQLLGAVYTKQEKGPTQITELRSCSAHTLAGAILSAKLEHHSGDLRLEDCDGVELKTDGDDCKE